MFLPSTFFLVDWLVNAVKVTGTAVHLVDLVLKREVTEAPVGGCRANNVR